MSFTVFVCAGEASADYHAAKVYEALKLSYPQMTGFGVGGSQLSAHNMKIIVPSSDLNVVGITDWAGKLPGVIVAYRKS